MKVRFQHSKNGRPDDRRSRGSSPRRSQFIFTNLSEIMNQFPRRRFLFDDIKFRLDKSFFQPRLIGVVEYDNGYGASIICIEPDEANRKYEVAVIHEGCLCYDTPVTNDVVPYCNVAEVEHVLEDIANLPVRSVS